MIGNLLSRLAEVCLLIGDYGGAKACQGEAVAHNRDVGSQRYLATHLIFLGRICFVMGEYDEAEACCHRALAEFQSLGVQHNNPFVFSTLGNVAVARGDYREASKKFQQAMEIWVENQDEWQCLSILTDLSGLLAATGKVELAVELAALALDHPHSDSYTRDQAKKLLGDLEAQLSPETFAAAQKRGKGLDAEATAKGLLEELAHR
jgi:tetratricopeptide (TPR) repeat protein